VAKIDRTAAVNGAVDAVPDPKAVPADARAKVDDLEEIGRAHAVPEVQTVPEVVIDRIFAGTIHANANGGNRRRPCPNSTFNLCRTKKASSLWRAKSK